MTKEKSSFKVFICADNCSKCSNTFCNISWCNFCMDNHELSKYINKTDLHLTLKKKIWFSYRFSTRNDIFSTNNDGKKILTTFDLFIYLFMEINLIATCIVKENIQINTCSWIQSFIVKIVPVEIFTALSLFKNI